MFRRLFEWLALTATERRVLLFVTGAFVAGLGIRLYQETFPAAPVYDYTESDSTYAALSATEESDAVPVPGTLLDLNTATKKQLTDLPGIGDVMAERILLHREDHGPFRTLDDLRKIKGLSKRTLEKIKPLVTISPGPRPGR